MCSQGHKQGARVQPQYHGKVKSEAYFLSIRRWKGLHMCNFQLCGSWVWRVPLVQEDEEERAGEGGGEEHEKLV